VADALMSVGGEEGAWRKVQAEAERRGLIKRGKIGQAECGLFKARRLWGCMKKPFVQTLLGYSGSSGSKPSYGLGMRNCWPTRSSSGFFRVSLFAARISSQDTPNLRAMP